MTAQQQAWVEAGRDGARRNDSPRNIISGLPDMSERVIPHDEYLVLIDCVCFGYYSERVAALGDEVAS